MAATYLYEGSADSLSIRLKDDVKNLRKVGKETNRKRVRAPIVVALIACSNYCNNGE